MFSLGAAEQGGGVYLPEDRASAPGGVPPGVALIPRKPATAGLIANALGYDRSDERRLGQLFGRIRMAAAIESQGRPEVIADFRTARLRARDRGWTWRGGPEGRTGGPESYLGAYVTRKAHLVNAIGWVALRLEAGDGPTLDDVAEALIRPERPLFIGRKACLPSGPILYDQIDAPDGHAALAALPGLWGMAWDRGEGPADAPIHEVDSKSPHLFSIYAGVEPVHYLLPDDTEIGFV